MEMHHSWYELSKSLSKKMLFTFYENELFVILHGLDVMRRIVKVKLYVRKHISSIRHLCAGTLKSKMATLVTWDIAVRVTQRTSI